MRTIFASYSFKEREKYRQLNEKLKEYLSEKGIHLYAFVFDFQEKVDDVTLMKEALFHIDASEIILIEASEKSVGVGLEAGYAKAKGKKIIYMYKKGSDLQQTINGISDFLIEYQTSDDIISFFENNNIL